MMLFLTKTRLKFYFNSHRNPWKIVFTLILTFTAWIYGRISGEISNYIATGETDFISFEQFKHIWLLAILVITVMRMVFPGYRVLKQLFPKYFPVSVLQRYTASLLNDLLTPYFFYLSVFILTGSFTMDRQGTDFLFSGFLVLAGSHFLRRSIQYSIDFRLSKAGQFISLVFFIMLSIGFLVFDFQLLVISRLLLLVCLLVMIGFIQECTLMESRNKGHTGKRIPGIIPFKLVYNNKKARLPLIIGLLFKTLILASDLYLSRVRGEHLFDGRFVYWLFASPLLIFTYVFNNIWGFWKNIWVNLDIRKGGYKPMIRQGLSLMLLPMSMDIVLTLPVLLLSWDNTEFVLLFYCTTIGYLMMLSFLWSLITPEKISSTFQMKGSTSFLSVIASAGGVLLFTTMKINPWFYFLIPLLLIGGGIALFVSIDGYNHKKYRIAKSL